MRRQTPRVAPVAKAPLAESPTRWPTRRSLREEQEQPSPMRTAVAPAERPAPQLPPAAERLLRSKPSLILPCWDQHPASRQNLAPRSAAPRLHLRRPSVCKRLLTLLPVLPAQVAPLVRTLLRFSLRAPTRR